MFSHAIKLARPFRRHISFLPKSKYGGRQIVTSIPSAGSDRDEILDHVHSVFAEFGAPIDFETVQLGTYTGETTRNDLENEDLQYAIGTIRRNGVALISHLETEQLANNIGIKNALKLHSCVSHIKSYPGLHTRHNNVDAVIVFQNVEGEYAGLEHEIVDGVVEMVKVATEESYNQVVETAFRYARKYNRKVIHAIHNVRYFPLVDGLFLKSFTNVAKEYPDVLWEPIRLKNFMSKFVMAPEDFDVICCPNAYGSGITAAACGLCGGPGLYSSVSYGDGIMIFEPAARKAKLGHNFENPLACLNAAAQMLYYLGCEEKASKLQQAIDATVNKDRIHTKDLGGTASTEEVIQNILSRLHLREIPKLTTHN